MRYVCWKISRFPCDDFTCRIKTMVGSSFENLSFSLSETKFEVKKQKLFIEFVMFCTFVPRRFGISHWTLEQLMFYNLELPPSIENTGVAKVMKMKDADKVRNEVISGTYRVSGLTKGSVLTLDIGPVPTTQQNGPKKPCKYRSEVQVGAFVSVMSYSWRISALPTFLPRAIAPSFFRKGTKLSSVACSEISKYWIYEPRVERLTIHFRIKN